MHPSAYNNAKLFKQIYVENEKLLDIIEIGSQDINGSLRDLFPNAKSYLGIDFCNGNGVDVVLNDPYKLPFASETLDIVLSSSCFEHSEFFWLLFTEIMRVLKPTGLFYLNAPSNGSFHRYPVDCWRFYPDSATALVNWAIRNGLNPLLLESYTSIQKEGHVWNDFCAVFLKEASLVGCYKNRILDCISEDEFYNGIKNDSSEIISFSSPTQDRIMQKYLKKKLSKV